MEEELDGEGRILFFFVSPGWKKYRICHCNRLKERTDSVRLSYFSHGVVIPPLTYYKVMFSFFQPFVQ